jgi:hypothetical protein
MPRTMEAGDVLKFSVWCRDSEQASVNTFYYLVQNIGPGGPPNDFEAAVDFDILAGVQWTPMIANTASYAGTQCQIVSRPPFRIPQFSTASAGSGTAGAIGMARQTAGLITWRTDFPGVSGRGRTYMPFPSTTDDAGLGIPTAGYQSQLDSLIAALTSVTSVTGAGGTQADVAFVLAHYALPRVAEQVPTVTFIRQGQSRLKWATQRRRGSFGRSNAVPF